MLSLKTKEKIKFWFRVTLTDKYYYNFGSTEPILIKSNQYNTLRVKTIT